LEKYLADFIQQKRNAIDMNYTKEIKIFFKERIKQITKEAWIITKKVTPYILL
jgi:uncharacterized membrane protein YraQ (UPF0718 family)